MGHELATRPAPHPDPVRPRPGAGPRHSRRPDPSDEGYETDGPTVQNQIEEGGDARAGRVGHEPLGLGRARPSEDSGTESSGLPFTGLDLGLLAGAGVLLVGLGAGMRLVLRLPPAVR